MKDFLSDYGLHWIGEKPLANARSARSEWMPKKAEPPPTAAIEEAESGGRVGSGEFRVDYDLLVRNIEELNGLTDEEEPTIVPQTNGATFATKRPRFVPLTLFANGLALYEGPFRSFEEDPLARKFCIDIMDGYFPSELQATFPDGVTFRLADKRHVLFQPAALNSVFHSKGYRLGSATRTPAATAFAMPSSEPRTQQPSSTPSAKDIETQLSGTTFRTMSTTDTNSNPNIQLGPFSL